MHMVGIPDSSLYPSYDLAEAFYRIVRPLAISGEVTDELLANVCSAFELGPQCLGGTSCSDAWALVHLMMQEMPSHAKRAVCGIHQDTHFALHGQVDRCVTTIGSRPGDAWADIVFGSFGPRFYINCRKR